LICNDDSGNCRRPAQPAKYPLRTLIVTAANEGFAGLLRGLVGSLQQSESRPYTALACFDLGLAPATRDWIGQHAAHVVEPGWDLAVDGTLQQAQPHLRALTVRPFLPRYFPGYDVYLWIDADAWVQDLTVIKAYVEAAAQGALAIVPHHHPAYRHSDGVTAWRVSREQACFGADAGMAIPWSEYWNAGVFALAADAPHWRQWAEHFALGLAATDGKLCCDQTALNQATRVGRLSVAPLPARYNWLCHLALPSFDQSRLCLCDPLEPQSALGILHLTDVTKNMMWGLRGDTQGRKLSLRYPPGFVNS